MRYAALLAVVIVASCFGPIVDARTAEIAGQQAAGIKAAQAVGREPIKTSPTAFDGRWWRYQWRNDHWWYWLPSQRWAYWTGKDWKVYQKAEYAQWWRQTRAAREAAPDGAQVAVSRSAGGAQRLSPGQSRRRNEVGDFDDGGFGYGGYANVVSSQRRYEELRRQAGGWPRAGTSKLPRLDTGLQGGIPGAGIGHGPYGGPVGRNLPGAIGNFGGANIGNPFGN